MKILMSLNITNFWSLKMFKMLLLVVQTYSILMIIWHKPNIITIIILLRYFYHYKKLRLLRNMLIIKHKKNLSEAKRLFGLFFFSIKNNFIHTNIREKNMSTFFIISVEIFQRIEGLDFESCEILKTNVKALFFIWRKELFHEWFHTMIETFVYLKEFYALSCFCINHLLFFIKVMLLISVSFNLLTLYWFYCASISDAVGILFSV